MPAIANKVSVNEPAWLVAARKEIGVKEVPGPKSNTSILQYYVDASHPEVKNEEVPWCAGFVNAMLKRGGVKGNGQLAARSLESWGQPLSTPVLGCVAVKKRGGNAPSWQGHVGFCVGANATQIFLLGGNQGDAVSIAAFPRKDFTAYRWPANIPVIANPLPKTLDGAKTNVSQA